MAICVLMGYTPTLPFNGVFLWPLSFLLAQVIFRNSISGMLIAGFFFLANMYFLLALFSELSEFSVFNDVAKNMVLVGVPLWLVNLYLSIQMMLRYVRKHLVTKNRNLDATK